MHIYLNASEIAGLINKNKYNPQEDVIYDIICRVKKEKNKADTNKLEIISKNELLELLKVFNDSKLIEKETMITFKKELENTKKEDVSKISQKLLNKVSKSSIQTKNTNESRIEQNKIETQIKNVMKNKDVTNVQKYIDGHINKTRGIINENKIIDKYEKKNQTKIKFNNSKLYKMKLFTFDIYEIYICGKIDGIIDDELIEIKNRRNRLFEFIPIYEQIQIEIYFRLANLNKGKLIQNYNDTTSEFIITSNDTLWESIKNDIKEACTILIKQLN